MYGNPFTEVTHILISTVRGHYFVIGPNLPFAHFLEKLGVTFKETTLKDSYQENRQSFMWQELLIF